MTTCLADSAFLLPFPAVLIRYHTLCVFARKCRFRHKNLLVDIPLLLSPVNRSIIQLESKPYKGRMGT